MIGDGEKQNKPNGKKEKDKPKENGKKYPKRDERLRDVIPMEDISRYSDDDMKKLWEGYLNNQYNKILTCHNNRENQTSSAQTPSNPKIKFVKLKTIHFII